MNVLHLVLECLDVCQMGKGCKQMATLGMRTPSSLTNPDYVRLNQKKINRYKGSPVAFFFTGYSA